MIYFLIGAAIGLARGIWLLAVHHHGRANYPFQGLAFSTVIGAATTGTFLWVIAALVSR